MKFGELIASRAKCFGDKTAVVYKDREYSYRELDTNANRLSTFLRSNGVKAGSYVVYIAYNSEMYFEILTACSRIGAIFTPINWRMRIDDIISLVDAVDAKTIFVSQSFLDLLLVDGHKPSDSNIIVVLDGNGTEYTSYSHCLEFEPVAAESSGGDGSDCLMQIYTSGTTCTPKGVMLSDNAVCCHALGHLSDIGQRYDSVFMCVLPLFHASSSGSLATLLAGGTLVVLERFRPESYLKAAERYRATTLSLTPSMFSSVLQEFEGGGYDLSSVKSVIYGAEPILAKYVVKANKMLRCSFYQLFGMTEMGPVVTILRAEDHAVSDEALLAQRLKSVGRVALGASIKIIGKDGKECLPGETGEIFAKGLGQMMGYYNDPEKTAAAFSDGWYHTGDMGYVDENNYLYLVGRMSDMIISGGENLYPKAVEECILKHENVENVAVIGLKDDHWGEAVTAIVVRKPGTELDEAQVADWCKGKIAGYMKPRRIYFMDSLPVTGTGKVDKQKLKEIFS